jgi:hypothetical protein
MKMVKPLKKNNESSATMQEKCRQELIEDEMKRKSTKH